MSLSSGAAAVLAGCGDVTTKGRALKAAADALKAEATSVKNDATALGMNDEVYPKLVAIIAAMDSIVPLTDALVSGPIAALEDVDKAGADFSK